MLTSHIPLYLVFLKNISYLLQIHCLKWILSRYFAVAVVVILSEYIKYFNSVMKT